MNNQRVIWCYSEGDLRVPRAVARPGRCDRAPSRIGVAVLVLGLPPHQEDQRLELEQAEVGRRVNGNDRSSPDRERAASGGGLCGAIEEVSVALQGRAT